MHMQRKYAEEEKAIEEKEKKALKARAEAEAGIFEDGKSTSHSRSHPSLLATFCALGASLSHHGCINRDRALRVVSCWVFASLAALLSYVGWLQQVRRSSSFPKRRNRHD